MSSQKVGSPMDFGHVRSMLRRSSVAVVVFGLVVGCNGMRQGPVVAIPGNGEELPILRHYAGAHCHEMQPTQFVVRSESEWARVQLRDIDVDFNTEMVLVVTLGRRSSDQFAVDIDRVWRDGGVLHADVLVRAPPPGTPVRLSSPYCMVVLPRCDLNVAGFDPEPPYRTRTWSQSPPPTDAW
ncbi:MAG: hypothetical protein ACE5F9_14405 [Phycisphaerae bacterium]